MTAWNFGEGRHPYSGVLDKIHRMFLFDTYGQKMWKIHMHATPKFNNTELWCDGSMECLYKSKISTLWHCYAEIELQAKNHYGTSTGKKFPLFFNSFTNKRLLSITLTAEDCFPDGKKRALNETFNFVLNIRILSLFGVEKRSLSDFSSLRNIDSEVTVVVGGQRLYVDKYPLLCFSSTLREIINNGMNSNNEIEIKDANVEDVVAFLRLLYRQKAPIKYENVEGLMSLIIRYDAQCVIPVVEEELISTVRTTIAEKFHIAELYGFSELQKVAFQKQMIEKQHEMEQQRRAQDIQCLAAKRKETSDMIRVFQQKVNEYERYVTKMKKLASESLPVSFSSLRNIDSEVTVVVGGQRLYVDKYPLLCFSSTLREIINNGMNSNNEIEIKDANVEDVVAFLRLLYRQKAPIKYENVEGLMSLIIRYDAQCVIPVVEEELISTVRTTIAEKFHIAELYGFSELRKIALQQQLIEKQCEMEKRRHADLWKETSDMIQLIQKEVIEDEEYFIKRDDGNSEKRMVALVEEYLVNRECKMNEVKI